MTNAPEVLKKIHKLVHGDGFIYALCMAVSDDFFLSPEDLGEIDHRERLSVNEVSFLLGILVQQPLNLAYPKSPESLIQTKKDIYRLLRELHDSFMEAPAQRMKDLFQRGSCEKAELDDKSFFGSGDFLTEAIFYAGTGVYDFQYAEYLEKKYGYDREWLLKEKSFDLEKAAQIPSQIKSFLEKKSTVVDRANLKENMPKIYENFKKKHPNEDWEKHADEIMPMIELFQYREFTEKAQKGDWSGLYDGLLNLFIVTPSDFENPSEIREFLSKFSLDSNKKCNEGFEKIGDYNLADSHPVLELDKDRFFVPVTFLLFRAVYESPFYWMIEDKHYSDKAAENRGKSGEEIAEEFLAPVFGKKHTFKSLKVTTKKGQDDTDIDLLCLLGTKALCVQVKSKKLTQLSRSGNDEKLKSDFEAAVQDPYEQAIVSRRKILDQKSKFIDSEGKEVALPSHIDEVFLMVLTTENYPSLTQQARFMLRKDAEDRFPIVLTAFDLELVAHYLSDPYDFLYYIRQRTDLAEYLMGDEEIGFLSHHLTHKLWKDPKYTMMMLDSSVAQAIDRNYYPLKAGLKVSDEGDSIKARWRNEDFDSFCNEIKQTGHPHAVDILFHLFDWSGDARANLVNQLRETKQLSLRDGKMHDFSIPPSEDDESRTGFTYFSFHNDNLDELKHRLSIFAEVRKYHSRGNFWIAFGSLLNSSQATDVCVYFYEPWTFDSVLEERAKKMIGRGQAVYLGRNKKKVGRNEKCPCGSGLKYKKCCLK